MWEMEDTSVVLNPFMFKCRHDFERLSGFSAQHRGSSIIGSTFQEHDRACSEANLNPSSFGSGWLVSTYWL